MSDLGDIQIIFILGAPGSGKGTLCKILSDQFNYSHLSVGDHLRRLCNSNEPLPPCGLDLSQLESFMTQHQLVPANSIVPIVWHQIQVARQNGSKVMLVDGFPRDGASAEKFDSLRKPDIVLLFECPKHIAQMRFTGRKRQDTDTAEVFEKRFAEFERNNELLTDRYRNVLISIDTSGSTKVSEERLLQAMGLEKKVDGDCGSSDAVREAESIIFEPC